MQENASLAVVGGGVIGLAIAWRAAEAGWRVTVHDPAPGTGASWVAGGMLAPLSEGWPGEEAPLELGTASLQRWPEFIERLGTDVITGRGSLTVALDSADAADLDTVAEWVTAQGHRLDVLDRKAVRELEPSLARGIRRGLLAHSELAVDNRMLVDALLAAARRAGVHFVREAVADLNDVHADQVVVAAGAHSVQLCPELPIRPVKGEILRLRARPGTAPVPSRVVRSRVHGRPVYLVPRADGIVIGATQYEHGYDVTVTVGGVRDLIADAQELLPGIGEYELHDVAAGSRPMSPDNLPLIGRIDERLVVATGHGRNGLLLTPITVEAVLAELAGTALAEAKHASPERLSNEGGRR